MSCRTKLAQERVEALSRPSRGGQKPEAFDLWLQRQLDSAYGKVGDEPLSPELAQLLGRAERS